MQEGQIEIAELPGKRIEVVHQGFIEQWKVLCSKKNNKMEDILDGRINIDISYKQRNCLNTTTIRYEIRE